MKGKDGDSKEREHVGVIARGGIQKKKEIIKLTFAPGSVTNKIRKTKGEKKERVEEL